MTAGIVLAKRHSLALVWFHYFVKTFQLFRLDLSRFLKKHYCGLSDNHVTIYFKLQLEIRIDYWLVTSSSVVQIFRRVAIAFFKHLFELIDSPFWDYVRLCGTQSEQIIFPDKPACNFLYILRKLIPKVVSITWQSCIISFYTALMNCETIEFGRP